MAPSRTSPILSPTEYDNDAESLHSASDIADDPDHGEREGSQLPDDQDRSLLREEEEQERLLQKPRGFRGLKQALMEKREEAIQTRIARRESRRDRRRGRIRSNVSGQGELLYEMEDGFKDLSSQSSIESFELDKKEWATVQQPTERPSCQRFRLACLHIFILLIFMLLTFGAYHASTRYRQSHSASTSLRSNGTHLFRATTILVSLDGFRADFLNRDLTPALNAFIASGVSPRYMLPSFPSVTFPNHFTLVTGLYPESHGIVGNTFWDPELRDEFYYIDPARSMQPKWWNAEPLWVTAEHQSVRTAIHMWPGSEAHIPDVEPTYVDKFNESEELTTKVDRILGWLDLPGDDDAEAISSPIDPRRPQLIAAYVPNVDTMGHLKGPNSTEIRATIADADGMLALLMEGLSARNLTEIVNIIVVSDHGMATTSSHRLIQLDNIIDLSLVDHIDGWPLRGLRLKNPDRDVPVMYEQLLAESKKSEGFDVYTKNTMPSRYHFTNNDRIAPLWIVPKTGWGVVERKDFDVAEAQTIGKVFHPMGMHGYDHEHPLMRAIFVARGPAFPHKPNSRIPVFQNIEVYNIVCNSLGIQPRVNNGTLRLPLKTIGLHSDEDAPALETPNDPVPSHVNTGDIKQDEPPEPESPPESEGGDGTADSGSGGGTKTWWDFVHEQLEMAKEWAKQILEAFKNNKPANSENSRSIPTE